MLMITLERKAAKATPHVMLLRCCLHYATTTHNNIIIIIMRITMTPRTRS